MTSRQYNHTGIQIQTMTKYVSPVKNASKEPSGKRLEANWW